MILILIFSANNVSTLGARRRSRRRSRYRVWQRSGVFGVTTRIFYEKFRPRPSCRSPAAARTRSRSPGCARVFGRPLPEASLRRRSSRRHPLQRYRHV